MPTSIPESCRPIPSVRPALGGDLKTAENAYRDVQIAFANEIALLCENLGADAFEVRRLVNTCPLRDMHIPGSGVGGHCLPKDSWLLLSGVPGNKARVIPYARAVNESMPHHLGELAREVMLKARVSSVRPKVAVMGLAFLRDSDDIRESPAIKVIDDLEDGYDLVVHDPFVKNPYKAELTKDMEAALLGADCAIFVTDHTVYRTLDLQNVKRLMRTPTIVDGRNPVQPARRGTEGAGISRNRQGLYLSIASSLETVSLMSLDTTP